MQQQLTDRPLPLILDGALATELEYRGANLSGGLWSARTLEAQPELIREVHLDYFRAGADIAITASYQATWPGLQQMGYTRAQSKQLLQRSVVLAREARSIFCSESQPQTTPLIAASIGPYGAYLADGSEYRGHYGLSDSALYDFHKPRLEWLLEEAPDLLAFETLPSLQEARVLLRLLGEYPEVQAWFSFTAKNTAQISEGQTVAEVGQLLGVHPQVFAIGFNCIPPLHLGTTLLSNLSRHTSKPLIIYPNSGEGWDAASQCWLPSYQVPQGLLATCPAPGRPLAQGLIGGCCRTRPRPC